MKTIGLIGGMSWESTGSYYRILNETVKARLGGLHSAKIVLNSIDFADLEVLQRAGDWAAASAMMVDAARALERAGADVVLIGANTMHLVAPAVESAVHIPVLHVADVAARALIAAGHRCVGLLGTRFTMEMPFYRQRLEAHAGLRVLTPAAEDRTTVHRVVYEELCLGKILPTSRDAFRRIMSGLVADGATAILLGCTEFSLLLSTADASVPLFDTAQLHAEAAVDFALT